MAESAREGVRFAELQTTYQQDTALRTREISAAMQAQLDLEEQREKEKQEGLKLEQDRNKRIAGNIKDAGTTGLNILSTGFEGEAPAGAPELGIKKLGEDSDVKTSLGDRLKTDLGAFKIEEKHDVDQSAAAQEAYDRLSAAVRAASQAAEQETKKIEGLVPKDLQGKFKELGVGEISDALVQQANNLTESEFAGLEPEKVDELRKGISESISLVNEFNANQDT